MVRRALLPALFVALGLAGVASAGLLTSLSLPPDPGDPGSAVCATAKAEPASSTAPSSTTSSVATAPPPTTTPPIAASTPGCSPVAGQTTTAAATTLTTSSSASTLVITGHGWGHGMGMSQWGADGYAHHGWAYARILAHYYRGTTIGRGPSPNVRVLLADRKRRVALASDSPWRVVDGAGTAVDLPAGKLVLAASLVVLGQALVSPLTFSPGQAPVELGKHPYRGKFVVISNGKRLEVVNRVGLESYVDGVVGGEVPLTWPREALETQAVAARTYALAQIEAVDTASSFDLFSDTRSQVYGGIDAEAPSVLSAVKATVRQIVLYHGKVATTYFSASSGGRTVSAAEAIGTPVPYLVSVPDPYDTYSPVHDWGPVLFTAAQAGKALGLPGPLVELRTTAGPSGHNVAAIAASAATRLSLTGAAVRDDLGLRSTWFHVGWLTLTRPQSPVRFGGALTLAGMALGVKGVTLEAKADGADWQVAAAVDPDATGAFRMSLSPKVTTRYRLAAGTVRGALIDVPVVPRVTAAIRAGVVQGTVRPVEFGSPVQIQERRGNTWRTIAAGATDSTGAFAIDAQFARGAYRVRCAPGHGLSPGLSMPMLVT